MNSEIIAPFDSGVMNDFRLIEGFISPVRYS